MKTIEGSLVVKGWKFALAVSRFNALITTQLLQGARDCLLRHGASDDDLTAAWVPGAFELPLLARRLAESGSYRAVIALGAVIRGDTPHFDQVVSGVTRGIAEVSLSSGVPVIFGVLTTDNLEQALERAGVKAGNKGWDAALSAIEMVSLLEGLG